MNKFLRVLTILFAIPLGWIAIALVLEFIQFGSLQPIMLAYPFGLIVGPSILLFFKLARKVF